MMWKGGGLSFIVIFVLASPFQLTEARRKNLKDRCPECECAGVPSTCPKGVPIVMDGCGCCPICGRQQGDSCDDIRLCDPTRKLRCVYENSDARTGVCMSLF